MIDVFIEPGTALLRGVWKLANSNFLTALAGAGACGAQWIVERTERKRRALEEIRATNAAIMAAYGIVNTFCALKNQHVRRLKETFQEQQGQLQEFLRKRHEGLIARDQQLNFSADFETLSLPATSVEVLQ